jgi:subtilase family serine protease
MNTDQVLFICLVISIIINMYQFFRLKRYQVNNNAYKAKWQEVMGLSNPINIILWIILLSIILISVPVALSIFDH